MPADRLAKSLIAQGKTVDQVVDATGLEPREVMRLGQQLKKPTAVKPITAIGTLEDLEQRLRAAADDGHYPKPARSNLTRAADAVAKALTTTVEDAGKAAKRAELARLEAQVKAIKQELRGTTAKQAPGGQQRDAKAIRAWATANGHPVPAVGRVPKDVVAAYDAAHQQVAS